MNKRSIQKQLVAKINEWVDTIDSVELADRIKKDVIVTGGCIASMLLKEPVNDYDLYFRTKDTALEVARYYVDRSGGDAVVSETTDSTGQPMIGIYIPSSGALNPPEDGLYSPTFVSENAITLSGDIQIIIRFFGTPDQIHANFDFVHCTNYFDYYASQVVLRPLAVEAILTKELKYVGSRFPICSMIRTKKFIKRGFTINGGQYLKMAIQISELDLNNFQVLKEQLIGVDTAYFAAIIDALMKQKSLSGDVDVSGSYVCELIDKVFG